MKFRQGDIVYLDFDPRSGHEQKGRRPAIVASRTSFNAISALVMVCPITHSPRRYPTHVSLPDGLAVDGTILCEQARFLDLNSRNAQLVLHAPEDVIRSVSEIIIALVEND